MVPSAVGDGGNAFALPADPHTVAPRVIEKKPPRIGFKLCTSIAISCPKAGDRALVSNQGFPAIEGLDPGGDAEVDAPEEVGWMGAINAVTGIGNVQCHAVCAR